MILKKKHTDHLFKIYTLENEHLEHKYGGLVEMIVLFDWVICRFQPLIFRGLSIIYFVPREN